MKHSELKYSFEIDGVRCGEMDVHCGANYFQTVTTFQTSKFGKVRAEFEVYFDGDRVIRARKFPFEPVDFTNLPSNSYPDCAYPLLIQKSSLGDFGYSCVDLERQRPPQMRHVARSADEVSETRDSQVLRRFILADGVPSMIDWGGAKSVLLTASKL